jgi:hypothetical protein
LKTMAANPDQCGRGYLQANMNAPLRHVAQPLGGLS